jgi:hypothetical protein
MKPGIFVTLMPRSRAHFVTAHARCAAVESADALFFQPVPLDDAVALLGRLAHPED